MISDVKQAIIDKLAELYPAADGYTVYKEDVSQKFLKPSFLVSLIEWDYGKRLNNKYKSTVSFDVAYFSDRDKMKTDCLEIQENLFREFDFIGTFKVLNKNARITDNVLHLTFDIKYTEMIKETGIPMQTQTTNTNL